MRDLKISYGNSCYALKWNNDTIRFGDLCKKLCSTVRTAETMEEIRYIRDIHQRIDLFM